jgi:hypothetical protein
VALTAVALLAICVPTAKAQTAADMNSTLDTLFGSHVPLQNFLEALKKAVAADDRPTVAGMIDYPFRARINGKAITIRDATHFVAGYDKIITDPVKQAIAGQSYATLFANWQGVSIGDGEVWFSTVGGASKVKITAITH